MKTLLKRLFACCMAVCMVVTMCSVLFTVSAAQTGTVTVDTVDATTADTEKVVPVTIQAADSGLKAAQIWLGVPDLSIAKIELKGEELSKLTATYVDATEANVVLDSFGSYVSTTAPKVYDNGQISILVESDELIKTAIVIEITFAGTFVEDTTYDITVGEDTQAGYDKNEDLIELAKTNGAIVVGAAHVHNYVPVVTDPTCTAQGYTTYTCACEDSYVNNYVDALGHDFAYADLGDGNHSVDCSRCDDADVASEAHNYVDGTCDKCGATEVTGPVLDKNIKPGTHTISTGETFGLGLRIQLDTLKDEYKSFRLDVKRTGYASGFNFAYFETSISEFSANQKFNALISKVTLYGIELFSTTAPIEYTLHCFDANGVEIAYSETFTTTLADAAIAYHDLPETKDSLKKVMADLIQVGAAALNEYTNNRTKACDYSSLPIPTIDSDFISKDLPTLSIYDWTEGSPEIQVVTGVQDRAYFNLTTAADYTNEADRYHYKVYYQNKASNKEDKTSTHYVYSDDMKGNTKTLFCSFKNIPMFATNEEVTFELYKDDVLISTRKYSIDSYIAAVLEDSSKKETLKTLLREVAKLGQSFRESRGF